MMGSKSTDENGDKFYGMPNIMRLIDQFFNNELIHSDWKNEMVILGERYCAVDGRVNSVLDALGNGDYNAHATDRDKDTKNDDDTSDPSGLPSGVSHKDTSAPAPAPEHESAPGSAPDQSLDNDSSFYMVEQKKPWPAKFIDDVESKIWITYRTGFPLIAVSEGGPSPLAMSIAQFFRSGTIADFNSGFTSDVGWGCMIRTSQMLLLNTLVILQLGRSWRHHDPQGEDVLLKIVHEFLDTPESLFSIHRFVEQGIHSGKRAGEWFGPTAASRSIQILCNNGNPVEESGLKVYLTEDGGDIYEDELFRVMRNSADGQQNLSTHPVLILSALRLGVDNVNPLYWSSIKKTLSVPHAVGIAGGRPKSSHYFFGYQDDYLFYFDPHLPQKTCPNTDKVAIDTYRTSNFKKLHLRDLDPSMLIGFLIKDESDYYNWRSLMLEDCKLFHFNERKVSRVLRQPSIVEMDDDGGFIDVGYDLEGSEEATGEATDEALIEKMETGDAEIIDLPVVKSAAGSAGSLEQNGDFPVPEEESLDSVMVSERRFSEPVLIDDVDLQHNIPSSSQRSSQVFVSGAENEFENDCSSIN